MNRYYAVNDRPVALVTTPAGGLDALVFNWSSGNLTPDREYLTHVVPGSGKDVDSFTEDEFNAAVRRCRADLVKMWAERMCDVTEPTAEGLVRTLKISGALNPRLDYFEVEPLPLGGKHATSTGGNVPNVEVTLPPGVMTLDDLEARLGKGQRVPRVSPNTPKQLAFFVQRPGTPSGCTVFGGYLDEQTRWLVRLMWRLERGTR